MSLFGKSAVEKRTAALTDEVGDGEGWWEDGEERSSGRGGGDSEE